LAAEVPEYKDKLWRSHPQIAYFSENPAQIGHSNPTTLKEARTTTWKGVDSALKKLNAATDDATRETARQEVETAEGIYDRAVESVDSVLQAAQYQRLLASFRGLLRSLLPATVITAVGITVFRMGQQPSASDE
jgi:hypothetical protein